MDSVLIDSHLIAEIKSINENYEAKLYFGKSLRDIKCVITDESFGEYEILIKYLDRKKLKIVDIDLPYSAFQEQEYISIKQIILAFEKYLDTLSCYIRELKRIDRFCNVVQPSNPTLKDDYRRIVIDERTWLHFEITPEGLAKNIHLIGDTNQKNLLQNRILEWNHDVDILENITNLFDTANVSHTYITQIADSHGNKNSNEEFLCGICLCGKLSIEVGIPQPLCLNASCGVYFHRMCLFQWLVTCMNGRPPTLGVASGNCPTCLQPIICYEKDE